MTDEEKQAVDAAIILENRVQQRVRDEVEFIVREIVVDQIRASLAIEKGAMIMEITTSINQMLRGFVEQERKPLWQSTPEEFGLTHEELNRSSMRRLDDIQQEINNAIRKQT